MKIILRYRFPEIIQAFGICFSFLFFIQNVFSSVDLILWSLALISSICSAFWVNDYFDFEDDLTNARKIHHHSRKEVLVAAIISFLISIGAASLIDLHVTVTVLIISVFSFLYSGPVLRFKSRLFLPFLIHFIMGFVFFQSASTIGPFEWRRESYLMAVIWSLILGTGSLGNELVDQNVDERVRIKTVANVYPDSIRMVIFAIQGLALALLMVNMIWLNLKVSLVLTIALGSLYSVRFYREGKSWKPEVYRNIYRLVFVVMMVAFHAEIFFRNQFVSR